jgi:hypothetical protein
MSKQCDCGSEHECGCGGDCDCGEYAGGFERQYLTKAEKIAELEDYLGDLKLEVQAVEEHLADLRK